MECKPSTLRNCLRNFVPRGFVAGHDYRHDIKDDGVNRAVNELLNPVHFPVDTIWAYLNGKQRKGKPMPEIFGSFYANHAHRKS